MPLAITAPWKTYPATMGAPVALVTAAEPAVETPAAASPQPLPVSNRVSVASSSPPTVSMAAAAYEAVSS